jgi:hypothetical protein
MNGRVYDYRLGRFLSVDPIISNPANSQSINPYSYIGNNPLSGTDPTGYVEESVCRAGDHCISNGLDQYVTAPNPALDVQSDRKAAGVKAYYACKDPTNCGSPQETAREARPSSMTPGDWARRIDGLGYRLTSGWQSSPVIWQSALVVPFAVLRLLSDPLKLGEGTADAIYNPNLTPFQRGLAVANDVARATVVAGLLRRALGGLAGTLRDHLIGDATGVPGLETQGFRPPPGTSQIPRGHSGGLADPVDSGRRGRLVL